LPGGSEPPQLKLLAQLRRSERLRPERLRELQMRALRPLLAHAFATTRFYRRHWAGRDLENFAALPLLRRRELQASFEDLKSDAVPPGDGKVSEARTSGSSGTPVTVLKSAREQLMWRALTLRDHAWHRRDLRGKLAVILQRSGSGASAQNWGRATLGMRTGPAVGFSIRASVQAQLDWLIREDADYLLTYPSLAGALAQAALERGARLGKLREVRTIGELLAPQVRQLCREAWNVPLSDLYSAQEVGYIALQCPRHEHYHVQSESVLVEVLDEDGRACEPGQVGRVVVTSLLNRATPLVRYELGDYAEPGGPCDCGRGLPVLRRVVGRTRNMLLTASGERYWPSFGSRSLTDIAPVLQHQFVQKSFELIEARLVTAAPLDAAQEAKLRELIAKRLPGGFRVEFAYPAAIERSAGGKYEDFVSEVSA
jgi:phenylacetate-CoA ligase